MTKIPFYQVDAFSGVPFRGNPAAACVLENALPDQLMQQIALENGVPATAFIQKAEHGYNLRWFTPEAELKLCGHGTLAAAHVLWEKGMVEPDDTVRFFTQSGTFQATKQEEWIQLNFPAFALHEQELPEGMATALGIPPVAAYSVEDGRWLIEIASEEELRKITPDFTALKKFASVVVTAKSTKAPYDFISRSFAPAHGVNEDPVTGSSHCVLVPYWQSRLNKSTFFAYQASARGGELRLKLNGNRVLIEGKAVTVVEGLFTINE